LPTEEEITSKGLVVLDTWSPKDFEEGHIPGVLNLPLTVNYAIWAGTLYPSSTRFFLITPRGKEKESIIRLAWIGYDNIEGVLAGGFEVYRAQGRPVETLNHIPATDVTPDMMIIDCRTANELEQGHIEGVKNVSLQDINKLANEGKLDD